MRTFEARHSRNGRRSASWTRSFQPFVGTTYTVELIEGTKRRSVKQERRVKTMKEARQLMKEWVS